MTRFPAPAPVGARSGERTTRRFDPRRGLKGLAVFAASGLGLSVLYATTGVGLPCPFRLVTGWDCPLCGGTRLGGALLHGDLGSAFAANPLVFVGLAVLTVLGIGWLVEVLGGPSVRPSPRIRSALASVTPTVWTVVALGVGVGYSVARNLWFPI